MQKIILSCLLISLLLVSGCGFFQRSPEYADSSSTNGLDAPPDLVTPLCEEILEIPRNANVRVSAL